MVTGSIATDHLMVFPGRFTDQLVADRLATVSLSFLVDELRIRRGGVAANIAFGMGCLGMSPLLLGAAGADFAEYRDWLERHGVDTGPVHISRTRHTARFVCTTDEAHNQIASFYAGAMVEARDLDLAAVADRAGDLALVVVAPNDPEAMVRHTEQCRRHGFAFASDPSQQLARMDGSAVRTLVDGAAYLFTNEYEASLLLRKTGWPAEEVLDRVGKWVTTRGRDGVRIEGRGFGTIEVPAAPVGREADPTGGGDAFRAGFLWGLHAGLSLERAAQAGCTLAAVALESVGTQEYSLERASFAGRVSRAYGAAAAGDIEARLRIRELSAPSAG